MASDNEAKIRERAYQIWQREGSPEGRGDAHWAQATHEIESDAAASPSQGGRVSTDDDPTRPAASGGAPGFAGVQSGGGNSPAGANAGSTRSGASGPNDQAGGSSGLQSGGAKPPGGPAAAPGGPPTGGGSNTGPASGSAADPKHPR